MWAKMEKLFAKVNFPLGCDRWNCVCFNFQTAAKLRMAIVTRMLLAHTMVHPMPLFVHARQVTQMLAQTEKLYAKVQFLENSVFLCKVFFPCFRQLSSTEWWM
jgi:hypothetical protein